MGRRRGRQLPKGWGREYRERNALLRELGYRDYAAYLRSPVWAAISGVLLAEWRACRLCRRRRAAVIHHNRYTRANLTGEDVAHLHPLCGACHTAVEHDARGRKLDMPAVRRKFAALLAAGAGERV